MSRKWINTDVRQPPVSSVQRRYWLQLYIKERVDASPLNDKKKGLALGLYMGSGNFRLAGNPTAITEKVSAWRPLVDGAPPVSNKETFHNAATTDVHGQARA